MKKFLKSLIVCLIILPCLFLSACALNGKSSYEIAVENGFIGTAAQWLESLKGTNGNDGHDGQSLDIENIYNKAVEKGFEGTFLEFLQDYLTVNADTSTAKINNCLFSVVSIYANFTKTVYDWFTGSSQQEYASGGAGVIYSLNKTEGSAFIITNFHVVHDASSNATNGISTDIFVLLYGQEYAEYKIPAMFVGGSSTYDIAVLKVQNSEVLKNSNAKAVNIADYNNITVGANCYAIGNPEGEGISITRGIISVDSETIKVSNVEYRVIRVDCAVNGGNSGGGLFNEYGELIGIVNAKIVDEQIEGIAYAIPVAISIRVAENIIRDCDSTASSTFKKAVMGLSTILEDTKAVLNSKGFVEIVETIKVDSTVENSLTYNKLFKDDILVSVIKNGVETQITRHFILSDIVLGCSVGDVITIKVLRDNVETSVDITFTAECLVSVQ